MTQGSPIPEKLHMLGVGGMGMAPLAMGLARAGWQITGEDDLLSLEIRKLLERAGVCIRNLETMAKESLPDRVVYSSAVKEDHPARLFAEDQGLPCQRRGSFLAEYSKSKQVIAVCGSHGKTTTTAMSAHLFRESDIKLDYYVGALLQDPEWVPAAFSDTALFLAEVDESDGTLSEFAPDASCILSLDWDHKDTYPSERDYREAFYGLAERTRRIVWVPDEEVGNFSKRLGDRVPVRGLSPESTFSEYNANAAEQIFSEYGDDRKRGNLDTFPGVARRQEVVCQNDSLIVMHDYAHHPEEIQALLSMVRARYPDYTLEVFFEPHRYSRTEHLAVELVDALSRADRVSLLPIYGAGERKEANSMGVLEQRARERFESVGVFEEASTLFKVLREEGASLGQRLRLFVGAGNIDFLAKTYGAYLDGSAVDCGQHLLNVLGSEYVSIDTSLSGKTTMRVGGKAQVYVEPPDRESLREVFKIVRIWGSPLFFLGKGSNLIVSDSGILACVVRLNGPAWMGIQAGSDGCLHVGAGVRLRDICKEAEKAEMGGFEFMEGIPASLGGALRMNAGAMGGWMSDVIESIEVMTRDGRIQILPKDALHYGYRSIDELADRAVLSARLRTKQSLSRETVKLRILENMQARKKSQPREASAGCIFKNPEGDHAGRLIDVCGLKGHRIGDAQVSESHANFIVNLGAATSEDIIDLVKYIRATVKDRTDVLLEPEAILVGKTWEEVLAE